MRLGIMAMQIGSLIPAGQPPQNVMTSLAQFDHAALVRQLVSHGFNPIELGGDLKMFIPNAYSPSAVERLNVLRKEIGVTYTVHLPLWSIEPSTPQQPVRQGSVNALIDMIRVTQPLEPEVYVHHAYGALAAEFFRMQLPATAHTLILQQFQNNARESIQTILAETGIPSRQLAIETIEFPFELTLALAEELDLSICFDTGHVLAGFPGVPDFWDALERCLPHLAEIHFHDAPWYGRDGHIGYGKDHQPLGTGDLDVKRFLVRLRQANFNGPLIFELRVEQALDSMQIVRAIQTS